MNSRQKKLTLKRRFAEKRFRYYGLASLFLATTMLFIIIFSMMYRAVPAFTNYGMNLEINLPISESKDSDPQDLNYRRIINKSILSLAVNLFLLCWRSIAIVPPPILIFSIYCLYLSIYILLLLYFRKLYVWR